ncbi:methyltransferase [Vibrio sp. FNV 38]|nr:methyltransferase [Vibrio sp. FNV 38]
MLHTFTDIDQWLVEHQMFWRIEPFLQASFPFQHLEQLPVSLLQWLDGLSTQQILDFKNDSVALREQLSKHIPTFNHPASMVDEHEIPHDVIEIDSRLFSGVPGRKLEQIKNMGAVCLKHNPHSPWLEWCSGKGYLGRFLSQSSNRAVTSLEFQAQLCQDGQDYAVQHHLPMNFVHGDAFSTQAKSLCTHDRHGVALHACGDLHVTLIRNAVESNMKGLTIAPCCYHLIRTDDYQPLSSIGKASRLVFSQSDLRIPLQETVTGGERVNRHRKLEMTYRLALQHLLAQELDMKEYVPIPSIKKSLLADGFKFFCLWAAEKKGFSLPQVDWDFYEQCGERLFWRMEALSLIPQLFRRPLEQWLVLDRAQYLAEQGYDVDIGTFCSRDITPRNLLIRANRQ